MDDPKIKSILDSFPVDDKAFPLQKPLGRVETITVVGACPTCGSPIYGPLDVSVTGPPISVQYTCDCRLKGVKTMAYQTKDVDPGDCCGGSCQ